MSTVPVQLKRFFFNVIALLFIIRFSTQPFHTFFGDVYFIFLRMKINHSLQLCCLKPILQFRLCRALEKQLVAFLLLLKLQKLLPTLILRGQFPSAI